MTRVSLFAVLRLPPVPLTAVGALLCAPHTRTMQPPAFYVSAEWQKARNQALHDANYACERCHASLIGRGREAHVHHRKPYKVAPALATEPLNLMALCLSCHNVVHHEMERPSIACDVDGNPTDASHPWNASP